MSIQVFNHNAMATVFQVRIADQEPRYAAQAARAAFEVVDRLEGLLSRFRENSEISQASHLAAGETLRLSEPVFACLRIAERMERATGGAFSAIPMRKTGQPPPAWSLLEEARSIRCDQGRLDLDLGAIGKGFALDRMAEELADWDCTSCLLVAGGSSVLAGAPPEGLAGWSAGLELDAVGTGRLLRHVSVSASGLAVKGNHIVDPRTGRPATLRPRVWAFAPSAAESDALSTACMILGEDEIERMLAANPGWGVLLRNDSGWQQFGATG
ncbi:MAG TPA: FAD:protein FMN transferase [Verrucomicrobia bacterium]|nr:FAD:protein FMN transferase [Verrucomicrobiota bacterium]HOB31578.1 FAD:protein FMN transferase [Verrucomicrobiota bacterium]HOP96865.1 FAD:protein FMN transferase [Verrucomicrobiota bacterium]